MLIFFIVFNFIDLKSKSDLGINGIQNLHINFKDSI